MSVVVRPQASHVGIKKKAEKRPSLAPEEYASMKLYYQQSYTQNLRQRLDKNLGGGSDTSEGTLTSKGKGHTRSQRFLSNASLSSSDYLNEVRPFTKDMPVRVQTKSPKQLHINLNPLTGNRSMAASEIAKAAAAALDKRCPRMELPDLYCFHADFRPVEESAEDIAEQERLELVDKKIRTAVGRLRKMHQIAVAHSAATRRITAKTGLDQGLSPLSFNPYTIGELVSTDVGGWRLQPHSRPGIKSPDYRTFIDSTTDDALHRFEENHDRLAVRDEILVPLRPMFTPIQEEEVEGESHRTKDAANDRISGDSSAFDSSPPAPQPIGLNPAGGFSVQDVHPQRPLPLPLHLGETAQQAKIIESKVVSQYWPNYLKVGKSKFARTSHTP